MQSMIEGWTVGTPDFAQVVAANKPQDIKLSKIYQRCAWGLMFLLVAVVAWHWCTSHMRCLHNMIGPTASKAPGCSGMHFMHMHSLS